MYCVETVSQDEKLKLGIIICEEDQRQDQFIFGNCPFKRFSIEFLALITIGHRVGHIFKLSSQIFHLKKF